MADLIDSPLTPATVPDLETLRASSVRQFSEFVRSHPAEFVALLKADALSRAVDSRPDPQPAGSGRFDERTRMPPATDPPPVVVLAPREVKTLLDLAHESPEVYAAFREAHPEAYARLLEEHQADALRPRRRFYSGNRNSR